MPNQTHPLIQAANAVPDWEDSFPGTTNTVAATAKRPTTAPAAEVSDFNFGDAAPAPIGQGLDPVIAARVIADYQTSQPAPAPATKSNAREFLITPPVGQLPPLQVYAGNERLARDYAGTFGDAPARDDASKHPFLARALKSKKVQAALRTAQAEQAAYRIVIRDTGPLISSEQQAADLLAAIANCSDIKELEKLRSKYAECFGDAARAAAQSARRICRVAYAKLETALRALVDVTVAELDTYKSEIESAEVDLFDKFGFTHQRTGIHSHLAHIRGRVAHHKAALDLSNSAERVNIHIAPDGSQVLETFL